MHPSILEHRPELAKLCSAYGVRHLSVFGSAARDDFDPVNSDLDLYVEFEDTRKPGYADRYLDFALEVERLFGRRVDLVTPRAIANPYFQRALKNDQVELYAA